MNLKDPKDNNYDLSIAHGVLVKLSDAINQEDLEENIGAATIFVRETAEKMAKGGQIVSKFGEVFKDAADVVDLVAPWLGPIGIGLKVTTIAVGCFV